MKTNRIMVVKFPNRRIELARAVGLEVEEDMKMEEDSDVDSLFEDGTIMESIEFDPVDAGEAGNMESGTDVDADGETDDERNAGGETGDTGPGTDAGAEGEIENEMDVDGGNLSPLDRTVDEVLAPSEVETEASLNQVLDEALAQGEAGAPAG